MIEPATDYSLCYVYRKVEHLKLVVGQLSSARRWQAECRPRGAECKELRCQRFSRPRVNKVIRGGRVAQMAPQCAPGSLTSRGSIIPASATGSARATSVARDASCPKHKGRSKDGRLVGWLAGWMEEQHLKTGGLGHASTAATNRIVGRIMRLRPSTSARPDATSAKQRPTVIFN